VDYDDGRESKRSFAEEVERENSIQEFSA